MFQLRLRGVVTEAKTEQIENSVLQGAARRVSGQTETSQTLAWEMTPKDGMQILLHNRLIVIKELAFCLEVSKLPCKVDCYRYRARMDDALFGLTQTKVHLPVFIGEAWQSVEFIDFLPGEDRREIGVSVRGKTFVFLHSVAGGH